MRVATWAIRARRRLGSATDAVAAKKATAPPPPAPRQPTFFCASADARRYPPRFAPVHAIATPVINSQSRDRESTASSASTLHATGAAYKE